jgi:DNA-binding response OmpR family regulator
MTLSPEETEILIVDDEPQVGDMLTDLLTESGYRTTTVRRGWDAVSQLTEREIHVAVVDKNLPDLSGLEVIRLGLEASPETVFLIVTAYSSLETAMEAMDLGASAYVSKPFDLTAFLERIDLARRRASRNAIFKRMLAGGRGGARAAAVASEAPGGAAPAGRVAARGVEAGARPPAPAGLGAVASRLRTVHATLSDIQADLEHSRMRPAEAASALQRELEGMKRVLDQLERGTGGGRSQVPSLETARRKP